jgi:hypothetical protein
MKHKAGKTALIQTVTSVAMVVALMAAAGCADNTDSPGRSSPVESTTAGSSRPRPVQESTMKLRLTVGDTVLDATLTDNPTSRDFAALLPLTLTLKDFNGTEKISDLPGKLSTAGAPAGTAAKAGDLTYYAPWGNLAIFYKDFGHSDGLIKLGQINADIAPLTAQRGPFTATLELAD